MPQQATASSPTPEASTTAEATASPPSKDAEVAEAGDAAGSGSIPEPDDVPIEADGIIDVSVLEQIRDMDEEDDDDDPDADPREFSRGIVWGFFEQAEKTFKEMEDAL